MTPLALVPAALGALTAAAALLVAPATLPVPAPAVAPASRGPGSDGQWPLEPAQVLTEFDDPLDYAPGHRGLDLAASPGQTVRAALPGVVTLAGSVAGRPLVVIAHKGGLRTTYLPMIPAVAPGERVESGDRIGAVIASAHCPARLCLHWGARDATGYLDPRDLLPATSGPIVLLPLTAER